MRTNSILALMLAGWASTAAAQTTAPPQRTLQQDFDEASNEYAAGNCQSAIPKFEALERGGKVKAGSLPAAAITVRKGTCLMRSGSVDADETSMQSALAKLETAGSGFDFDVADGWRALGTSAFRRFDYRGASAAFKRALFRLKGTDRLDTLSWLAKAATFDGASDATDAASEALAILTAMPKPNKESLATFHTLRARALLNRGQADQAYKDLKQALTLSGGLTTKTTLSEVALRGDLAIAAMLLGKKDDAKLYLAYTGAGRIEKSPFKSAASMNPPLCGDETGLRPDDLAVVEFSIAEDGTVASAQTVYSRGGPPVAAAFGRAVSEWYWTPEKIAAVPPFYRALTRVELRCSNLLGNGAGLMGPLRDRFFTWASAQLQETALLEMDDPALRAAFGKYVGEGASQGSALVRIAALGWLSSADPVSPSRKTAMADEALKLAAVTPVPQEVVNWLKVVRLNTILQDKPRRGSEDLNALVTLANEASIADDALAADTLRLDAARGWLTTRLNDAPTLLAQVAKDERLPAQHPLRQLAWLELAGRAASEGNRAAAQDYFSRTGLTEEQCALLREAPRLKRTNIDSNDYPMDALRMGFEGWVETEFDIQTDGKTANIRPIIAYPPLVFVTAANSMTKNLQYNVSFRPGSSNACSANRETINFVIPR